MENRGGGGGGVGGGDQFSLKLGDSFARSGGAENGVLGSQKRECLGQG